MATKGQRQPQGNRTALDAAELEGGVVEVQLEAEGFDDELVVGALGQAGDGDAAEDAGAGDGEREGAAMGGVVGLGEGVLFGEGGAAFGEGEADGVGAAVEAGDDVRFALDPAAVVRGGAGEGGVEELLERGAEAADVDDEAVVALDGEAAEGVAERPGGVGVEGGEGELALLLGDAGAVFGGVERAVEAGSERHAVCLSRGGPPPYLGCKIFKTNGLESDVAAKYS